MQCGICGDGSSAVLEQKSLGLYRCGNCGHVFKEISETDRERYGDAYFSDTHKNWFNNPDYALFDFIYNEILKIKGNGKIKILDIGCGNGNFLKFLKGKDGRFELYGVDYNENSESGISFIKSDILKYETPLRFDIICNLTVIEHLDSPQIFVSRLKGLLSSGGIVFTVTDNDDSLIYKIARVLKKINVNSAYDRLYDTHHMHCFSRNSLRRLFEMNGFEILLHKNHNHPVRAIDYPKANAFVTFIYKVAAHSIFFVSGLLDMGILQIIVCRDKAMERASA